jgi:hypothetical protein
MIYISATDIVVGEADGFADFVVRLSAPSAASVSVSYSNSNGTAANGSDYIAVSGTLTFAPGEMVKTVRVPIIDDTAVEGKESFFFFLSNPTGGAVIGKTEALATIIDNDAASGTPVMAVSNPVVDETAGEAQFVVTLDRPSTGVVSVNYATQAGTAGAADFGATNGTLSFAPGETAKTVSVTIADDGAAEPNEKFNLALSSPSGATLPDPVGTATIWASNQPTVSTPVISVDNLVVGEADGFAEFVVRLGAPSAAAVSVSYSNSNGTAANGSDYIAVSGTLIFAPGEMVKTVRVPIIDDTAVEGKESFFFFLSNPTGGAVIGNTEALATIIDNDAASGTPLMAVSNPVVDETAGEAQFVITLDRPSTGVVSVNYATQAGTAGPADFAATSGTLSFAPGETAKTVSVTIADDTTAEPSEKFSLVLSSPSGATLPDAVGTATIWASDQPTVSTPVISVDNIVVGEQDGFADFVVRLSAPSAASVSVSYSNSNGTAANGSDYIAVSGRLTFAPGEMVKTVRVPIIDDTAVEGKESFFFFLSNPTGGAVIGNTEALATIIDNDAASGTPVMAVSNPVVDETAGEAQFVITLDRPSTGVVSVNYATRPGTAGGADFGATSGTLSFAPGETAKTVSVTIADDTAAEPNEIFSLVLSSPSGATLPDAVGTATIWASDQPTVSTPVISVDNVVVGEQDGFAEFLVQLSAPSGAAVSVSYSNSNGTAANGSDYIAVSGTLTFAPGEMVKTVRVPIVDDPTVEPNKSFLFNLSNPTGAAIGNSFGTATIIDNATIAPPEVAAPGVVRVALNVPTPVSGIRISENGVISGGGFALPLADNAAVPSATAIGQSSAQSAIFTVTVADSHGLLSATGSGITGLNTTQLTIVGSLSEVNADLATLRDLETTAGSDAIRVTAVDSNGNISLPVIIPVAVRPSTSDAYGVGNSDIFWQNNNGEADIWATNGTTVSDSGSLGNPGPSWHERGTGDFNGGGRSEILWQNNSGEVDFWQLNAAVVTGSGSLGNPGPSWHTVGAGDFNGDGHSDILWRNSSGEAFIWEVNGTQLIGSGSLGNPGPSWHAIGVGYFNDDGYSDILWQNDSGEAFIWEMNGTQMIGGGSLGNPGPSWHALGTGDFNGDGFSDVLWQNSTGEVVIWEMNGTDIIGSTSVGNPGADWHVSAIGDYNGDGLSDILWQNSNGEVVVWEMNGSSLIGSASLGDPGPVWRPQGDGSFYRASSADLVWQTDGADILLQNDNGDAFIWGTNGTAIAGSSDLGNPGPTWHVKGAGDFNGDGSPDLLWQNDSGEAVIWDTNGTAVIGSASLGNPGPSWHIAGIGDFNHDGRSDILWQNSSGEAAIWEIGGSNVIGAANLGNPGPSWHVKGTGDFNGDGFSDVLWQNDSGEAVIWEMNGTTVIGAASVGNPGPSWQALGTGDFNGDGRADILWRNDSGEAVIWEMNGTNVLGSASVGNPGPDWHIIGTGDYNHDGKSDILWQNSSGAVAVWELNGTSTIAVAVLANPGATWHA